MGTHRVQGLIAVDDPDPLRVTRRPTQIGLAHTAMEIRPFALEPVRRACGPQAGLGDFAARQLPYLESLGLIEGGAEMDEIRALLREAAPVLVAFSGGVDSSLLLKVARDVLGEKALAVIASSETYPEREVRAARALARRLGGRTLVVHTRELDNPRFYENTPRRCYHCKLELFSILRKMADERGIGFVLDGSNADDRNDYRPGGEAGRELGVRSPLQEAGLTKAEIRTLSKMYGLPTWDKPAAPCLAASRT